MLLLLLLDNIELVFHWMLLEFIVFIRSRACHP